MNKAKMSKEEIKEWNELYEYVKTTILGYNKDKKLSKWFVLRLVGLHEGKFCANKTIKPMANYDYKTILMTFKMNKIDILNGIKDKDKFKDEQHKINYIMVIIENKINDTYDMINRVNKAKEKAKTIEITNNDDKAEYKRRTKEVKNSRLKDLL